MMSLNLEFGPAVFPLKVYPHHNSKLHVCHHHVLKADQGIFDGEEISKGKQLFAILFACLYPS